MKVIYRHTDLKNWLDKHPQYIGQAVAVPARYIEAFNLLIGDCIAKGLFTFEQLASVTQGGHDAKRDPKIQDWLKQEQQYVGQVLLLSKWAAKALRYAWVRQEVTDGTLAFEQLANINLEEYRVLITKRTVAHLAQKTVEM